MAMIQCPVCGKEISEQANTCVHCGSVLRMRLEPVKEEEVLIDTNTAAHVPEEAAAEEDTPKEDYPGKNCPEEDLPGENRPAEDSNIDETPPPEAELLPAEDSPKKKKKSRGGVKKVLSDRVAITAILSILVIAVVAIVMIAVTGRTGTSRKNSAKSLHPLGIGAGMNYTEIRQALEDQAFDFDKTYGPYKLFSSGALLGSLCDQTSVQYYDENHFIIMHDFTRTADYSTLLRKMTEKFGEPANRDSNSYYKNNAVWRLKDSGTYISLNLDSKNLVSIYYNCSEH